MYTTAYNIHPHKTTPLFRKRSIEIFGSVWALALWALAPTAKGQITYDFLGSFSNSSSALVPVGDSVNLSITLESAIPISNTADSSGQYNYFPIQSATLTLGETVYDMSWTQIATAAHTDPVFYGFFAGEGGGGNASIDFVQVNFASSSPVSVDSNYLPLAGLHLSDFDVYNDIGIYDNTWGVGGNYSTGTAVAYITSYSVSSIPEPITYAALLGVAALGFAAVRRRQVA